MNSCSLSVLIPTYNRPEALLRAATAIAEQLREGEELLVYDNASKIPATEVLAGILKDGERLPQGGLVRVVRHEVNVGMSVNIGLGMMAARGEWVWTLGDDDVPYGQALERIREELKAASGEICWLKFSAPERVMYERREDLVGYDAMLEHGETPVNAGNLIFLSTSIFRVSVMKSRANFAFHYASTLAPQLVLAFLAMTEGRTLRLCSEVIVEPNHDVKDGYAMYPMFNGTYVMLDMKELRHPRLVEFVRALNYNFMIRLQEMLRLLCEARRFELRFWVFTMVKWLNCVYWGKRLQILGCCGVAMLLWICPPLKRLIGPRVGARLEIPSDMARV